MKNVTIALEDEVHRKARIRAAELGTSLSALVKDYLVGLAAEQGPQFAGVREMPMPFRHAEPASGGGPPWLAGGKSVYPKDSMPRQPGSMRDELKDLPDNWDEWPPEMLAYFDKLNSEPWDDGDPADHLLFDESQLLGL